MPLTTNQVTNAKPGRHSDGRGLYLLVKPSGSKSWVLRVQYKGKRSDFGLGSVTMKPGDPAIPIVRRKSLNLADAREKARLGRDLAKAGVKPGDEWAREAVDVPTFEAVAREYHKQVSKGWRNGKHGEQWITTLEAYAFPTLGALKVDAIDAKDIQSILIPIWLTIPETARRVRQRVGVVLDYAKGKGWRTTDAPLRAIQQLMGGLKQPKGGNFPAMPYADLPAFVRKVRSCDPSIGRLALQFLILTIARSGEVRKARWSEIDLDAAEWSVPPLNAKMGRLHIVPLTDAALAVLRLMRDLIGGKLGDLIFPGHKGKIMSDATLSKVLRVTDGDDFTVHGFRSTFRDWAAETGQPDAWAEAALSHKNPDKVVAAYKRTTFFAQRRDQLMPAWSNYCEGPTNLISLAERRG